MVAAACMMNVRAKSPPGPTTPVTPLAFGVAWVKPIPTPIPTGGGPWIVTHGRFRAETAYVHGMIGFAYDVWAAEVKGGPDWIDRELYFDARAENRRFMIDHIERPSPN
ncbi:MAG TPA: hypothetical protein VMH80_20880 [Bryobacteraceae bacterium]|nr:hypothetical protein [Bryobacteraceae bacterium]